MKIPSKHTKNVSEHIRNDPDNDVVWRYRYYLRRATICFASKAVKITQAHPRICFPNTHSTNSKRAADRRLKSRLSPLWCWLCVSETVSGYGNFVFSYGIYDPITSCLSNFFFLLQKKKKNCCLGLANVIIVVSARPI